jgi:probable blue pigment (indigoidine) exporter
MKKVSTGARGAWTAGATLLAPISWGTSYVVITELLPDGRPLLVATMRVLPSGLVLLIAGALASRWRPRGSEWWRTGMLALFNFGVFFPLLVAAVYRLPGGVAAAVGGLQPLLVAGLSWPVAGRRPRVLELAVGCVAALGVGLVVIRPGADLDPVGVLAAVGANVSFAVGVVLTKRFPTPSNRLAATGWQLLMGGMILVPLTGFAEGAPPALTADNVAGFAYLSLIATALAFTLWFNGVRRLPTAAPPLLGLAAPVTGAVLGWAILGQSLSPLQLTGFVVTLAAIAYGAGIGASAPDPAPPDPAPAVDRPPSAMSSVAGHRPIIRELVGARITDEPYRSDEPV